MSSDEKVLDFPRVEVTSEENARRVMVEARRLARLAPGEWRLWIDRKREQKREQERTDKRAEHKRKEREKAFEGLMSSPSEQQETRLGELAKRTRRGRCRRTRPFHSICGHAKLGCINKFMECRTLVRPGGNSRAASEDQR